MTTINITVSNKIDSYIAENSEFQNIIREVTCDYIEKKEDQITKLNLKNNDYFKSLNNSLEIELGK